MALFDPDPDDVIREIGDAMVYDKVLRLGLRAILGTQEFYHFILKEIPIEDKSWPEN